jgi:hypothetical protein
MTFVELDLNHNRRITVRQKAATSRVNKLAVFVVVAACLGAVSSNALSATLSRSMVVRGTPSAVWSLIGPFCAIKDWLPPVGSCTEDGKQPPTRTLVTKDGGSKFIERQTARSETKHFYSYTFQTSPLPVTDYSSTILVIAKDQRQSTVTWRAIYTPDVGRETEAKNALDDIYAAGLNSIKNQMTQQFAHGVSKRGAQ